MPPFKLRDHPPEVWDQVQSDLPVSDKMIMCMTCGSTKSEVSSLFHKEAIFKIKIDRYLAICNGAPSI